jgi:hypothetical protein
LSIVEMKEVRECRGNSDERTGDSFSEQSARRRYSKEKTTQQTNGLFDKERSDDAVLIDRDVRSVKPMNVHKHASVYHGKGTTDQYVSLKVTC